MSDHKAFDDTDGFEADYDENDFEDDFEDDFGEEGATAEGARELSEVLDANVGVDDPAAVELLKTGKLEVLGRMPWSSNGTYLVTVTIDERRAQGIYKPAAGERPLWDFPTGLWRREVAAYQLAVELGWDIVPPTVERDGPLGPGSLQFFVPAKFEEHYFTFRELPGHRRALEQICVFDLVSNNTDRKGGHILLGHDDHLWGIDHGVSFHEEFKLRTVMWDFSGDPIGADLVGDLIEWLERGPSPELSALLTAAEVESMADRTRSVISTGRFPSDPTGRRYPWPLV